MQWIDCVVNSKTYTIVNVHGLWNGKGKGDSTQRITQSHNIRNFLNKSSNAKIICGDFNLRPDTESISIISENMDDLVGRYEVQGTRTSIYDKEEKYADYIFTSPEVRIRNFEVLPDEVSDHSPLLLEFS